MATPVKIGIDVGGTKVFTLVLDAATRKILARTKADTPAGLKFDEFAAFLAAQAAQTLAEAGSSAADVQHIGVAVPSSVDPATGVILHSPALGWKNLPARTPLEKAFGRPVLLDNDVNCGVLAEARLGAGRGSASVVGFFVGTGLGGGIVMDGKLIRGLRGSAGEFGHTVVRSNGRKCGCGKRGCLEAYCSKTAFGRRFERLIEKRGMKSCLPELLKDETFRNVRSKVLAKAYRRGDPVVCNVLDKGADMLGIGVANVMATLAPACVVLGGGVMEALGTDLLPFVRRSAEAHLFGLGPKDLNLKLAEFGDDAVALGAALLDEA